MNDKYFYYFLIIALILIVVTAVFPYYVNYFFNDWATSASVGDTYGGLNALFSGLAFAGLIITILIQKEELGNQRQELALQRSEMIETRKEFLLNRTTTLVYNQLERFERSLNELKISYNTNDYEGNAAISFLDYMRNRAIYVYEVTEHYDENTEKAKQVNRSQSDIHIQNKTTIEKFAHNSYNSIEVLKSLIFTSTLEVEELNELKKLFFENIGFINMGVIEHISDVANEQLEIFTTEDYIRFNIEPGEMRRANIFLKSIIKFYKTRFTIENFEALKAKWREESGRNN